MNVLDGPSIANLCDYDFGDQAGCIGGVPGAFMMKEGREINESDLNRHFTKSDRIDRIFNDIISWRNE